MCRTTPALFSVCLAAVCIANVGNLSLAGEVSGKRSGFCVVSFVDQNDTYDKAAQELVTLRKAAILRATPEDLEPLVSQLRKAAPRYVAFVVRPDQFDVNLAHRVLKIATQIDDDPFIDFSYGFITGRTPEAAVQLAKAGVKAQRKRRKPSIAIAGVAGGTFLKKSMSQNQILPLKKMPLKMRWNHIVLPESNDGQRDTKFIDKALTDLEASPLIAFAGHGFPDQVVGGPNASDIRDRNYEGAVAFNIACYTGVTSKWFEQDWKTAKLVEQCVEPTNSFCLQMIDSGVAAYVAYSCPRPAGMEMFADMVSLATEGISVGEQRRRQGNSVILTHLAQSFDGVVADELTDGQQLKQQGVEATVREMSAGGVLFGDPAFVPFKKSASAFPIALKGKRTDDKLLLSVRVDGPLWFWHCSDPLEQTKFRLQARIPLGERHVQSVAMSKFPFGQDRKPLRVSGAVETHLGRRYVHVKGLFDKLENQQMMDYQSGVQGTFVVKTTNDVAQSKQRFLKMAAN